MKIYPSVRGPIIPKNSSCSCPQPEEQIRLAQMGPNCVCRSEPWSKCSIRSRSILWILLLVVALIVFTHNSYQQFARYVPPRLPTSQASVSSYAVRIYIGIVFPQTIGLMVGHRVVELWRTIDPPGNVSTFSDSGGGRCDHRLRRWATAQRLPGHVDVSTMGARELPRSFDLESDGEHERGQNDGVFQCVGESIPVP